MGGGGGLEWNTVEPLLVTPLFECNVHSRDKILWSRKNVHIIIVFVTSVRGHLYSGERDTFSGSQTWALSPFRGNHSNQKVTDHKNR